MDWLCAWPDRLPPFALMPSDLIALQGWLRMSTLEQSLAQRARILLLLADGLTPKAVSEQLQVTPPTVFKWRKRYLEAGIEGLSDMPRSGQPLKLGPDKINEILTLTTRRVPQGATHWSGRWMAKCARVTTWQVRQVWAASDLKPHRLKTFKISNDPHFTDKVVDVVGLYLNPPDNALVLSVDEKPRSRRWIAPNRCSRYAQVKLNAGRMITSAMVRRVCTRLSTS